MNKGPKFIPCSHFNKFHMFSELIYFFEKELLNLNFKVFLNKSKSRYNNEFPQVRFRNCDDLECFFKQTRNKIDVDCIPLQKETIEFKFDLYKNFQDLKYDMNFNISEEEFISLKKFLELKPFKVIEVDKNIGVGIISIELYEKLALEQLNDKNFYFKLDENPFEKFNNFVNSVLRELCLRKDISKSVLKKLLSEKGELGSFRLLPKLHKKKFGVRPIISYKKSLISNLCLLIDLILQPHVRKFSSYIKDSQNLIQDLHNFNIKEEVDIYSCDFESLYTNIDLSLALNIITDFVKDKLESTHINIRGFYEILKIVLFNNFFKFKDLYFKQIKGIAMGTKCGPSIANVYVNFFEEKFLVLYKPIYYKRFIDDIFLIVSRGFDINNLKKFFKPLILNVCTGNEINFLDLSIKIDTITGRVIFKLYIKETNSFNYLNSDSNHPDYIFKNIPKGLFIRIRRICTNYSDFLYFTSKIIFELIKKGYKFDDLRKICNMVGKIDRSSLIPYKLKPQFIDNNSILVKSKYSKNIPNLNDLLFKTFKNFRDLDNNPFSNLKMKVINGMHLNLNSILVHGFKLNSFPTFKSSPCFLNGCNLCKYTYQVKFLKIKKFFLPILSNNSCISSNATYIIKCNRCLDTFYIGQTKNIKVRIRQHILDILNFIPFVKKTSVSLHFNLKDHCLTRDFRFFIVEENLLDLDLRLKKEASLIFLFKKLEVNLMNDYIPNIHSLF